jgi:hypothetical protein
LRPRLFRYLLLLVNIVAYYSLQPIPIPSKPSFWPADCTVVVPTAASNVDHLIKTLFSIAKNEPAGVIIVTVLSKADAVGTWCNDNLVYGIQVFRVEKLNKLNQMLAALR